MLCEHVVYKASGALLSGHPARRCCGHHCPVCGGHAWALTRCCKDPTCNTEADVPWRWELDRVAHKCYGKQHRFDVERSTGRSLSDFMKKRYSARLFFVLGSNTEVFPRQASTKAGDSPTCRGSAHGCTRLQAGCFPYFPSPTKNASIARLQNLLLGRPLSRATCVHRRKRRKSRYARTLLLGRKQGAETPSLSAGCRHHECSSYIEIPANSASCLPVPGMRALHAKYSDIGTPQLFRTPTKSRNARRCLNHRSSVGDCVPETAADLPVGKYATCSSRFRGHRQRSEDLPTHNS